MQLTNEDCSPTQSVVPIGESRRLALHSRQLNDSAARANQTQPSILWIDDEITSASIEVRFLQAAGFRVDCAISGRDGLVKARADRYGGILLDLKLPDLPGLSVLATLRAERIATPVLVLTGFADLESARVAGLFGASGFKAKPLFVDELEVAVRRLVEKASAANSSELVWQIGDSETDDSRASLAAIASLLEQLHRLSGGAKLIDDMEGGPSESHEPLHDVSCVLIHALANSALPMIVFLACAAGLKNAATQTGEAKLLHELASNSKDLILETFAKPGYQDPRVAAAIDAVRRAAVDRKRVTLERVADSRNVSAAHLSRLVKEETGFDFTEWRSAFLMRLALAPLVETDNGH